MKKVLIIGYWVRGSPRLDGLTKYLPEFYWQPIFLAPPQREKLVVPFQVIETPYRDALGFGKRLLRLNPEEDITKQVRERFGISAEKSWIDYILHFLGAIANYPDTERGWKPFAIKVGSKLMQAKEVDAIISSSSPITCHLIAHELKTRYKIPWLADLRDLWSQNHNYSYGRLRRRLDRRLELKTLAEADALITVSEPWTEKLGALHRGKPVYTITHGFDPDYVNTPPAKLTNKFTITYTGAIYAEKQEPAKFFIALRDLISDRTINPDEIVVSFYGERHSWLDKEIEQYGLADIVKQYGIIPQHSAIEKQRESHLLLVLKWEDTRERGWHSLKIFEYLGARRPILATGGARDDVAAKLLDETQAGRYAPTVEDIKHALEEIYREYKLKGEAVYKGKKAEISRYSHREMARKFAELLDQVIQK